MGQREWQQNSFKIHLLLASRAIIVVLEVSVVVAALINLKIQLFSLYFSFVPENNVVISMIAIVRNSKKCFSLHRIQYVLEI